jgi:anaerobic magnesium-protoporphyrin IX monomethyl ester cyclase
MERLAKEYDVALFHVMDNCFTSDVMHLEAFCQEIMSRGLKIEWDCNSFERLDNLDASHLAMMRSAGCVRLHMGVESAAAETRRMINKKANFIDYERVMWEARRAGMGVTGWFILGFPGESRAAMRETVCRAYALPADQLTFTPCFPLRGSEAYAQWAGHHQLDQVDWAFYDVALSPYPVSELSSRELIWLTRRARLGLKARLRSRALGALWARWVV